MRPSLYIRRANRNFTAANGTAMNNYGEVNGVMEDIDTQSSANGTFAVTDGTFAGDGPGPRAMRWHVKNVILASADQVAIDATVARLMGFDPMSIEFIRLGHEVGLGCGDPNEIETVGDDLSGVNWRFDGSSNTFASRGQKLIYWGSLKPLESMLLRTPLVQWAFFASNLYHNEYWLRFIGRKRIREAMKTEWGKLFQSY